MKSILVSLGVLTLSAGAYIFKIKGSQNSATGIAEITMCGPVDFEAMKPAENGKYTVPLPGWGSYHYGITTSSDSAQFYFDQGLSLYYSYHMPEAAASFREASRFDPGCAMAYWGEALTMGPYYNAAHSYTKPERIAEVLAKMNLNINSTSEKEKKLIQAINIRFDPARGGSDLKTSDLAYAEVLQSLIATYPDDVDIKMLYVDAVMLMHAWDFWDQNGGAKPWTEEVVLLSERVLKSNPEHPAALHYYIHLTEASHQPQVALANADALKKLFPGVPHMVHMASHEYQRNGFYAKGVEVNDAADSNLRVYHGLSKNLSLNTKSPHYYAVQTYCALSGGMYEAGMRSAEKCRASVKPTAANTYDQYLYMMPVITMVRLGKWKEIIADQTEVKKSWTYAQLLNHFAKGMAYAHTSKMDSAQWHLTQLRQQMKDPVLDKRRIPFNAPADVAPIAEQILYASIQFYLNHRNQAIEALRVAIAAEDKLIYTEPNDWPLPARQYLGAYLSKMRVYEQAEQVYRDDLVRNPGNGWSNLGLWKILKAQKQTKDLDQYKRAYRQAFSHASQLPTGSAYIR